MIYGLNSVIHKIIHKLFARFKNYLYLCTAIQINTIMKHKLFLLAFAAILFAGCEKQKIVDAADLTISFEYREVESVPGYYDFDIRSTSTPSYVASDLWYFFGTDHAAMIGDGHHRFNAAGTYNVTVQYKPVAEHDQVRASRTFTFTLTGAADSTWIAATPTN